MRRTTHMVIDISMRYLFGNCLRSYTHTTTRVRLVTRVFCGCRALCWQGRSAGESWVNWHVSSQLNVREPFAVAVVRPSNATSELAATYRPPMAAARRPTVSPAATRASSSSFGPFTGCWNGRFRLVDVQLVDKLQRHSNTPITCSLKCVFAKNARTTFFSIERCYVTHL